jgi:hypothetical protein
MPADPQLVEKGVFFSTHFFIKKWIIERNSNFSGENKDRLTPSLSWLGAWRSFSYSGKLQ